MTITILDSRKLLVRARTAVLVFLIATLLGALPLGLRSAEKAGKYLVYVGTYTNTGSKGIYAYRFDSATGTTESLGLAAETAEPSFLAVAPNRQFLYAANEMQNYNGEITGAVSSFAIVRSTGKLSQLNELPSRGADPAFLSLDKTGKYVLVANYTGGTVAVFPVLADGKLGEASAFVQHTGSSVNHDRQASPHPHMIMTSPDNRFALVPDLGLDEVIAYRFDATKGTFGEKPSATKADPGSGPRHIAFSPNGHFVYLISEMGSAVTTFSYHAADASMTALQTVPVEPASSRRKAGAEVQVSASGKSLYASNRFDNVIVVYAIDPAKGTLTQVQSVALEGKTPRHFALDPTGQWLWEENQDSNSIVIYRVDPQTGQLSPSGRKLNISSPTCVVFVPLR
jgi:6-phosphogluconolactonase